MNLWFLSSLIALFFRHLARFINQSISILPPLARASASVINVPVSNPDCDAITVIIDITAYTAGSLTVAIGFIDRNSGKFVAQLTSTALAAAATTTLKIGRGLTAAANLVANDDIGKDLQIRVTPGDATSITYSVSAQLIGSR